jgi:hypothetical protein
MGESSKATLLSRLTGPYNGEHDSDPTVMGRAFLFPTAASVAISLVAFLESKRTRTTGKAGLSPKI